MTNLAKALVSAQTEMSNPVKGSNNPFFKSKYADLNAVREAVLPVLNAHGITVLQPMCSVDGKNFIKTILLHESGEMMESLTEIVYSKQNDAQAQGSGITYARRYALQSFVCVGADDDDGNAASRPKNEASPKAETNSPAPNISKVSQPTMWLNEGSEQFTAIKKLVEGGEKITLAQVRKKYKVNNEVAAKLNEMGIA